MKRDFPENMPIDVSTKSETFKKFKLPQCLYKALSKKDFIRILARQVNSEYRINRRMLYKFIYDKIPTKYNNIRFRLETLINKTGEKSYFRIPVSDCDDVVTALG